MDSRHILGRDSEDQAALWLEQAIPRCRILTRNFRCRSGEIDLVLEHDRGESGVELVFVEVRARDRSGWVSGLESIDWRKRRSLGRAAAWFLKRYEGPASGVRFDVMSWDGCSWTHVPNAWYLEGE